MTALSIVIPTWNGVDLLRRFLPSVVAESQRWSEARGEGGSGCEVVVSDDGSEDETAAWLNRHYPQVRCVAHPKNQGFAPAANAGVAAATAPIVVLLNNDLELAPQALDPIPAWFADPAIFGVTLRGYGLPQRVFATGGKLGRFRRGFWETWRNYEAAGMPGAGSTAEPLPSFMLVGGFCAFRRSVFAELGGFDPIFTPYYSEDLDLSYRARKRGWKIGYEPRSLVYHEQSSTVRRHRPLFQRAAITERNRLLFHWRNLDPPRLLRHLLWAHLLLAQMAAKGNFAYHAGYWQALRRWPEVRRYRQRECAHWRRTDLQLTVEAPDTARGGRDVCTSGNVGAKGGEIP